MSESAADKKTTDLAEIRRAAERVASVLIVDEHPDVRRLIKSLVDRGIGAGSCTQADNVDQASKTLQKQHIDFAIVNMSSADVRKSHPAEKIKLNCPSIPILAISIRYPKSPYSKSLSREPHLNPDTIEQITAGIKYMKSLSHSGVSGFTVTVKE